MQEAADHSLNGEEWKEIPQSPSYAVSNLGRVKSERSRKILKAGLAGPQGRHQVRLPVGDRWRGFYVHRLVAQEFVTRPCGQYFAVRHVDGDVSNNAAANLEWVPWDEIEK